LRRFFYICGCKIPPEKNLTVAAVFEFLRRFISAGNKRRENMYDLAFLRRIGHRRKYREKLRRFVNRRNWQAGKSTFKKPPQMISKPPERKPTGTFLFVVYLRRFLAAAMANGQIFESLTHLR
jgi:hypothetical protein